MSYWYDTMIFYDKIWYDNFFIQFSIFLGIYQHWKISGYYTYRTLAAEW